MRYSILCAFILLLSPILETYAEQDLFDKARVLYNEARFSEAISLYQEIIKNDSKNIEAYLNLAYLYKDLQEFKQAIGLLEKALKIFEDERLKMLLGRLYYLDGKPDEAIFHLRQILSSNPRDPEVLLYLGLCYEDKGELTEAENCYLKTIEFQSYNTLAYLKLGNVYHQKRRLKEAAEIFQRVISLDPSITEIQERLAECFEKLGDLAQAYKHYAKYAAIRPQDSLLQEKLEKVKTELGENFFRQKKELISKRQRIKLPQVRASAFGQIAPQVSVGIAKIKDAIEFKCGSDFKIVDKQSGNSLYEGKEESIYSFVFNKEKANIKLKDSSGNEIGANLDKPFLIKNKSKNSVISFFDIPFGIGNFWAGWHDKQYRGTIEVIPEKDDFQLINIINLEEYLYGVLPAEMPADWPKLALRTQAIAARTWAARNLARHNHQGFNFCNSVHCQVYKGAGAENQRTNQAVDDTAGLIIASDNKPVEIFYSSNCGGCTRDGIIDSGLRLDFEFPLSPLELEEWLAEQPDMFCNFNLDRPANFRWARLHRQKDLETLLDGFGIDVGGLLGIIPKMRAMSGHLVSIRIEGVKNTELIEGENNIRKILGNLRSSAFKIEVKYNQQNRPQEFIFYGAGFGHGKGLCQSGMKGMALKGYNYRQILKHYYPEARIKKIY